MDVIILCGGKGLRMSHVTSSIPKPLAIVKGKPIIWHIMKHYSNYGYNDFLLPLGYKGNVIKDYFHNYNIYHSNYKYNLGIEKIDYVEKPKEDWNITFVDTGEDTMTGARVKKLEKYIKTDPFLLTYGDGISDINIDALIDYHHRKGKLATVTGIAYKSNYGILTVKDGIATSFKEKPLLDHIVNGGFFVCSKQILSYLSEDKNCVLEETLLKELGSIGELAVYEHKGYWIGIDTNKDIENANALLDLNMK
ncbi:MAG: glucose-1-phosphate cytidylyltransferase [Clostridia bacterium]|nr:glucose-1-phosphate cytidylyltransferase [Clostridia bacterium]